MYMLKHGHQDILFNSSAKYRAGGHFKWKPDLRLPSPVPRCLRRLSKPTAHWRCLKWQIRLGISWKALPLTGGSASLISISGAPLPGVVFHLKNISKLHTPSFASLYWFYVYYTTRRILEELRITLPGDESHSWYQNNYDAGAYKRLCSEFGVSADTDWRQKLDHGCQGLGSWSTYMTPSHEYRHPHQAQHGIFFNPINAIRHKRDISTA